MVRNAEKGRILPGWGCNGAGAAEEGRAEMKAEAVGCLAASQEAELFVNGGDGRWESPSFTLRDGNDFACFGHARV